jgi:hypothetical protein
VTLRTLAVVAVAALAVVPAARADGDPASDYLITRQTFLPFDAKIPEKQAQALNGIVADANEKGYKIRVAIISKPFDLGAVPSLYRKPTTYARFLGQELAFVYKNRLLIVMPNGFGFNRPGHPTTKEYATLSKIKIAPGATGLVTAAQTGVEKLAAASGVTIKRTSDSSGGHSMARDRVVIIIAAVALLAVAVALRLLLRRKRT